MKSGGLGYRHLDETAFGDVYHRIAMRCGVCRENRARPAMPTGAVSCEVLPAQEALSSALSPGGVVERMQMGVVWVWMGVAR